ncbi:hypothetical protein Tco_0016450 [Tanacetum coccineum]
MSRETRVVWKGYHRLLDNHFQHVPGYTKKETYANIDPKNIKLIDAEAEAAHMILNEIGNDIYSTVDACANATEMWIAIEHATTRNKGKEIVKQPTPPSESASEENYDEEHTQRYRTGNDINTRQIGNQRTLTVVGNRETIGNQDTDEESDEQELEVHYMYMAKIHEVLTADSRPTYDVEPLEKVHTNDDYNVFATERQHTEQPNSINDTYVVEKVDNNVIPD